MKERILERKTVLNSPIEEVFTFFEKAENLNKITPDDLNFAIITEGSVKIRKGAEIDYKISIFGLKVKWKTLISEYNPPKLFVDKQLKGPYLKWVHYHIFESIEPERTIMTDRVFYKVPGWILEPLIHHFLVLPKLKKIFFYRQKICESIFNSKN